VLLSPQIKEISIKLEENDNEVKPTRNTIFVKNHKNTPMTKNCFTTNKLLSKEEKIVAILRDSEDLWEFVGNKPNNEEEIVVVSLDEVYAAYPELQEICEQLELSQCAVWDNIDSEWLIDDYDEEEEYDENEDGEEEAED
jgi:hypothetical protein